MIEVLLHTLGIPHPEGVDGLYMQVQHACTYLVSRIR